MARGFGGSILLALPLLMTMEMWWLGFYLGPLRILLLMAVFFPILIGVARRRSALGHHCEETVAKYFL
jgi:uncharacterized membrane protein